ncbi:oxalate decarboxylase/phosphoglucose isomerase-like protein (cupin superfamily) [Kitasatospora sp. MAA4]|nr:oxalate decarboxylase/phosphoglucose isomerase-like protein (cupin superfamily) [Kitasatospora sp. MAA4]
MPAGTLVMVPPGAPHTFANPGDQPLVTEVMVRYATTAATEFE